MNSLSPTTEGLRLILRRPAILLAEIAWRWSFAAAGWFLGVVFLLEYIDSLPVTPLDRLLLRTGQPILIGRALHRIFEGSSFRFTQAGILLGIGLTLAWIGLNSLGRAGTVNAILGHLELSASMQGRRLLSLSSLNFLRAAVTLAAAAGTLGAVLIASSFWASTRVSVAEATRLVFLVWFLIWLAWSVLNWLLSTAAVLSVAEDLPALPAIVGTIRLLQRRHAPMLAAGGLFGIAHLATFVFTAGVAFTTMTLAASVRFGAVVFLEFLIIAGYCFVADLLYTSRMAAYIAISRGEELQLSGKAAGPPSTLAPSSIDKNELILSDLPLPAS